MKIENVSTEFLNISQLKFLNILKFIGLGSKSTSQAKNLAGKFQMCAIGS